MNLLTISLNFYTQTEKELPETCLTQYRMLKTNLLKILQSDRLVQLKQKLSEAELTLNLPDQYAKLVKIQEEFLACEKLGENTDALVKAYYETTDEIKKSEEALNNIYSDILTEQKHLWQKAQDNREIKFLETFILSNLQIDKTDLNFQRLLKVTQLCLDAFKIYHDKAYIKDEHGYQFQVRYLIANHLMGSEVEWFCKSGEDRTGRLAEMLEEFHIYFNKFGTFPIFSEEKNLSYRQAVAKDVHNYSVNRDIACHNVPGARGLQGSSSYGENANLEIGEFDALIAKTAKKAFKVHKNLYHKTVVYNQYHSDVEQMAMTLVDDEHEKAQLLSILENDGYKNILTKVESEFDLRLQVLKSLKKSQEIVKGVTKQKGFFNILTDKQRELFFSQYLQMQANHLEQLESSQVLALYHLKDILRLMQPQMDENEFCDFYQQLTDELPDTEMLNRRSNVIEQYERTLKNIEQKQEQVRKLGDTHNQLGHWMSAQLKRQSIRKTMHAKLDAATWLIQPIDYANENDVSLRKKISELNQLDQQFSNWVQVFDFYEGDNKKILELKSRLNQLMPHVAKSLNNAVSELTQRQLKSVPPQNSDWRKEALKTDFTVGQFSSVKAEQLGMRPEKHVSQGVTKKSFVTVDAEKKLYYVKTHEGALSYAGEHCDSDRKQMISAMTHEMSQSNSGQKNVFISGLSKSMQQDAALRLHQQGFKVYLKAEGDDYQIFKPNLLQRAELLKETADVMREMRLR